MKFKETTLLNYSDFLLLSFNFVTITQKSCDLFNAYFLNLTQNVVEKLL